FTRYARLCGLPDKLVGRYALRNALPPVVTLVAVLYSFLIGGAVLVEFVFGWGGAGQYAVQGVLNADFQVVPGFVLVAAVISLVASIIILALTAPLIAPFDPEEANASITLASPSASHWLGTDISGMDIFSRIIYSARIDLVIAVLGTCFSILIGGPLGLIAGYFSGARGLWGWISEIMMRGGDGPQGVRGVVL